MRRTSELLPSGDLEQRKRQFSLFIEREREKSRARIRPEDFTGIYNESEIAQDEIDLDKKRETYEGDSSPEARSAEIVFPYMAEYLANRAPGIAAAAKRTAEYDDEMRGVDAVIEFEREGEEPARLAVDVTTASKSSVTEIIKNCRFRNQVAQKGELTQMKYYQSPLSGEAEGARGVYGACFVGDTETMQSAGSLIYAAEAEGDRQAWAELENDELRKGMFGQLKETVAQQVADAKRPDVRGTIRDEEVAEGERLLAILNDIEAYGDEG